MGVLYVLGRADATFTAPGIQKLLPEEVASWEFVPLNVVLFGSAARKEMRTGSDIDIFIALPDSVDDDLAEARIAGLAARISAWTGNDARPLVYGANEIASAPVFDSIIRDGLTILGEPGWLLKVVRKSRVAG